MKLKLNGACRQQLSSPTSLPSSLLPFETFAWPMTSSSSEGREPLEGGRGARSGDGILLPGMAEPLAGDWTCLAEDEVFSAGAWVLMEQPCDS